jgi:hypothetical protein
MKVLTDEVSDALNAYIKANYETKSALEIAEKFGISRKMVRLRAWRLGVSKPVKPKPKITGFTYEIPTGQIEVIGNKKIHRMI